MSTSTDNSDTSTTPPMLPAIAKDLAAYPGLAASWYILATSHDLNRAIKKRKPLAVKFNGQKLVVWRGLAGQIAVLDNYCSHMGASLAQGKITPDGCVACPFHGWHYDAATGACVQAPLVKHIPNTARQVVVIEHVVEKFSYIWGWYGTPKPLFELPTALDIELNSKAYRFGRRSMKTSIHPRQILENALDPYHFLILHGLKFEDFYSCPKLKHMLYLEFLCLFS